MSNDEHVIWRCPACGKRVHDGRAFVAALEGEEGAALGFDGEPIWIRGVRFHEGHFLPRIRGKVYVELEAETGELEAPSGVETVRAAYEALSHGDAEPLIGLMDTEVCWRGRRRATAFWRPPPS
jgi:hypothetical protein